VQQSTIVELILNLKTAKTLGVTVPLSLLGRADKISNSSRSLAQMRNADRIELRLSLKAKRKTSARDEYFVILTHKRHPADISMLQQRGWFQPFSEGEFWGGCDGLLQGAHEYSKLHVGCTET
jgi:hypothetical protein